MKQIFITAVILSTLTACHKTPEQSSSEATNESTTAQYQNNSKQQLKEQAAEAAAIAHDRYDPDSIYEGVDNAEIPQPQLKRELLPSETLEVKFRPVDAYPNFTVVTQTTYDITRLKVVSEINDVIDKVETDNQNCIVTGVEPYTVKFPTPTNYGDLFKLVLDGCRADEINEVYLYTTRGKITYRAIAEN